MNVRWVISHLTNLPGRSRVVRHYNNSVLTPQEHMLADIIDILRVTSYYTSVGATSQIDKSSINAVHRGAPKPIERPVLREESKPKKFVNAKEFKEIMGNRIL